MEENTNIPTPAVNETAADQVVNSILEVREDMTREELLEVSLKALKKSEDQEKRALKAEAKLKETKAAEEPQPVIKEKPKQSATAGSGLTFEDIELVNKGFSKKEIADARKFADVFGMNITDAAADKAFLSKIERQREMKQAADALISGAPSQTSRITEDDFESGVLNGSIDIESNEGNRKRYKEIIKRKAVR